MTDDTVHKHQETYFTDTELPITMWQDGEDWFLEARWNDGQSGERSRFDKRPNRDVRKLMHQHFLEDYKLWQAAQ